MSFSYCIVSLIFTCVISTVHLDNATVPSKGTGQSSCWWYGSLDTKCSMSCVPCSSLPTECTSFFWDSFSINLKYEICDTYDDQEHLKSLCSCSKPVYVTYGYGKIETWGSALQQAADKKNADEWKNLLAHMSNYSCVSGLILDNLDVEPGQQIPPNFSTNLKNYISTFKEQVKDKGVGIHIFAHEFMLYYKDKKENWIDFNDINSVVDFYVISTTHFNPSCTSDFKTGLVPLNGDSEFTMEKLMCVLNEAKLSKEKLIFHFPMNPVKDPMKDFICDINYSQMCLKPNDTKDWCADTISTYYDKGKFTQQNAMGFVAEYVDLDDSSCTCNCNRTFPGFHAILDGFKGAPPPPACKLFDRS